MASLFSEKQEKKSKKINKNQAILDESKRKFTRDVMFELMPETIISSFEMINNEYCHGSEKAKIIPIKEKYENNEELTYNDLQTLNDVFKAVSSRKEQNGGDCDE